jgi:serine/threonine protein kinase
MGSSGFGTVFKARNIRTKLPVAVKKTCNKTIKEFKQNNNELRLLKRCQHKNVVIFLEAYNLAETQEVWVRLWTQKRTRILT